MNKEYFNFCNKSSIEVSFMEYLNDENIKVISFDIFDTLAFRDVSSPEDIFHKIGESEYVKKIFDSATTFKYFRVNAEKRTRQMYKNIEDIKLDWIYEQFTLDYVQQEKIKSIEIEIENSSIYINKQLDRWLKLAHEHNKIVVLTSDIYLSYEQIEKVILEKLHNRKYISTVYLSSEYGKSKKKSGLYKVLKNDMNIEYNQIVHIGDNYYSDIKNARELGLHSIHYNLRDYLLDSMKLEKEYIGTSIGNLKNIRVLASVLNPFLKEDEIFFYELATTVYGPIIWESVRWIKKEAKRRKISQINFVMREGKIFKKYFDKLNNNEFETNLIYASRKSTYLSSLDIENFSIENFPFHEYRELKIEDFYDLFNIKISNNLIKENKIISCEKSKKIFFTDDKSLHMLMVEDLNSQLDCIKRNILIEKDNIQKYLKKFSIKKDSIIFDFGGTGTILKRISKVLEKPIKYNFLFYIHDAGYENLFPSLVSAFFKPNDKTKNAIRLLKRTPEFTELLLNGLEKTTIGYEKSYSDEIKPITKNPYAFDNIFEKRIEAFNYGLDAFFSVCNNYKFKKVCEVDTLALILSRCIDIPNYQEVEFLGDLYTDEGKGSSHLQKLVSKENLEIINKIGVSKTYYEFMKNRSFKRKEIHWMQANISSLDNQYLCNIKGLLNQNSTILAIEKIVRILDNYNDIKEVNIYGAGELFKKLSPYLDDRNIKVISIIDTRAKLSSFKFLGYEVKSLEKSIDTSNSAPIIVASAEYSKEITNTIKEYLNSLKICNKIINYSEGVIE